MNSIPLIDITILVLLFLLTEKPQVWPLYRTSPRKVHLDDNPILGCFAMGCPTPDIIWFKDNLPLTALGKDHHFSVDTKTPQIGNRTSDLEIKAVQFDDKGDYVCAAHNALGSYNYTISLYVTSNAVLYLLIMMLGSVPCILMCFTSMPVAK